MTLHVAVVTGSGIIQVGDRLVTQQWTDGRIDVWDPTFNKTLLVDTINGRMVISFAGLAHLDGIPTDQWLLQAIEGLQFTPQRSEIVRRESVPLSVGRVRGALVKGIAIAFSRQPDTRPGLEVLISGWTWKSRYRRTHGGVGLVGRTAHPRMFMSLIKPTTEGAKECYESVCRLKSKDRLIWAIGETRSVERILDRDPFWSGDVHLMSPIEIESKLVELIRQASQGPGGETIGRDVMSVIVPFSNEPNRCRYHWDTTTKAGPVWYSPIVLSDEFRVPSSRIAGAGPFLATGTRDPHTTFDVVPRLEELPRFSSMSHQPSRAAGQV